MEVGLKIFAFLFAIFLLVTLHEFGHFIVARRLGIKTLKFSIGFGKAIWRWFGKDGTEYVIAVLPLGGYVKLLDEREGPVPDAEKHLEFNRKPLWVRTLVVIAGPLINLLLAIVAFWLVFTIGIQQIKPIIGSVTPNSIAAQAGVEAGDNIIQIDQHKTDTWQKVVLALVYRMGEKGSMHIQVQPHEMGPIQTHTLDLTHWNIDNLNPDPMQSLGFKPYMPPVTPIVFKTVVHGPADQAGLLPGDKILKIADSPINDWVGFVGYLQTHPGTTANLLIVRDNQQKMLSLTIDKKWVWSHGFKQIGYIGVQSAPITMPDSMKLLAHYSPWGALVPAWQQTVAFTVFNFVVLKKMLLGQISLQGLGGPITIFTSAGAAFIQGIVVYINFLGILSLMLACINILPIPGLDGGHLLFFLIEAIRRRPISVAAQLLAWRIGLILLIMLMLQATMNDLLRLF